MSQKTLVHSSPKRFNYINPWKPNHTNRTELNEIFENVTPSRKLHASDRDSMKRDILDAVSQKTETVMGHNYNYYKDNMYEDPKDVIGTKPPKPPRARDIQAIAILSPDLDQNDSINNDKPYNTKSLLKEQKRKLTKKYEGLITTLMDRCEENNAQISEKESHITKLKEKLKQVLEYNKLFAEENDTLKTQYETLVKYVEEIKKVVKEERERSKELEERCKDLEQKIGRFIEPDRGVSEKTVTRITKEGATAASLSAASAGLLSLNGLYHQPSLSGIPLVEVCMSCNRTQIALTQARDQTVRAQKDMRAMKDVLYRLNIQLGRYQEKLRSEQTPGSVADPGNKHINTPDEKCDGLNYLIAANMTRDRDGQCEDGRRSKSPEGSGTKAIDISGLLSAQALAPLFDAYQGNIQEKDNLIHDYEKQMEIINKKTKEVVTENKTLAEKLQTLEEELVRVRQSYKKTAVEKEAADIEKATLLERAERAEAKLKEVYECYEDKMSSMMRDYETVHREYFAVKTALEASEGKAAQIDVLRARTVPADLHERRLEHCKRLLEELKHQYSMESERKAEHTKKVEDQLKAVEEKHNKLCQVHESLREELRAASKNVKLYRKAAQIFRERLKAATARMTRVRRSARLHISERTKPAIHTLERIRSEIKAVKIKAHTSLEELERRIVEQERRSQTAQAEYRRELDRATLTIEHKEGIIRSLIDKVNDIQQIRLCQGSSADHSPDLKRSSEYEDRKQAKPGVKLVPGNGGYFQERTGNKDTDK